MVMVIILAISLVVAVTVVVALAQFGIFVNAQGQVDNSTSSLASSLTSEQRDALCNPNNPLSMLKSINTTESHLCGLPKTSSSNITTTSAANFTTGTEALPPSSAIPGLLMPEQPPSQPTQSESIQPPPSKSIAPSAVPPKSIAPSQAPPQFPPTG